MEEFVTTREHNMPYDKHNYTINEKTSEDMNNINKEDLNEKLKDIKYLQVFLKKYAIKNNIKVTSASKLFNIFSEEYGTIELDYNSINDEEKVKLIKTIKKIKSNAKEDISKYNIKEIINNNARSDNNDNDDDSDGDNDNNYKKKKNVNKHSSKE